MPNDDPTPTPSPKKETFWVWFRNSGLKEIVTTLIALWVTCTTLLMFNDLFDSPSDEKADVLAKLTPVFGAIIGYYFGRVPAERQAQKSEDAREAAEAQANHSNQVAAAEKEKARSAAARTNEMAARMGRAKVTVEEALDQLGQEARSNVAVGDVRGRLQKLAGELEL